MAKRKSLAEIMREEEEHYGDASADMSTSVVATSVVAEQSQTNVLAEPITVAKSETEELNEVLAEVLIDSLAGEASNLTMNTRQTSAPKTVKRKLKPVAVAPKVENTEFLHKLSVRFTQPQWEAIHRHLCVARIAGKKMSIADFVRLVVDDWVAEHPMPSI